MLLPKVKLKTLVSFPSNAVGGEGVDVVKQSGNFVINLDFGDFAPPVSQLPAGSFNVLLWDNFSGKYVLAPVGTLIGQGISDDAVSDGFSYGRLNATWQRVVALAGGTMTGPLALNADPTTNMQAATKQYVDNFAAPFDAMSYNGMQINGSMDVSQENGGNNVVVASGFLKYVVDGWGVILNNAGKTLTCRQAAGATPNGVGSSLLVEATAGIAAPANGDSVIIRQSIEGYRAARLGWGTLSAQPLSYGFYINVMNGSPGTIFVRVANAAANRLYYVEHTVAAANTWVWCSGTIPGDVTGTWVTDNGIGIYFDIFVMGKSATIATPGAWTATQSNQTTNSTNMFLTTDSYVYVTGVVVLPGIEAPSAARSALIHAVAV